MASVFTVSHGSQGREVAGVSVVSSAATFVALGFQLCEQTIDRRLRSHFDLRVDTLPETLPWNIVLGVVDNRLLNIGRNLGLSVRRTPASPRF